MTAPTVPERSLAEHVRERSSGILTVTDGKVRRLFCLRKGALVHAASNIIEEQFEEFLVRGHHITPADRVQAKLANSSEGVSTLEYLVRQEILAEADLDSLIRDHVTGLLRQALETPSVETRFVEGQANLEGKPVTELALEPFLMEFVQNHPKSTQEVRVRLGKPGLLPVRVADREEKALALAGNFPVVAEVWKLADGDLSVAQLTQNVPSGEGPALRTLYGLMLLGAVDVVAKGGKAATSARQVPVTQNELLARFDRADGASHYDVLELGPGAGVEEVRRSYYMLAQRYHPDRFRAGEHIDLLPRIEEFFAKVTEAYNTLSDPEARRAYEEARTQEEAQTRADPMHDATHLARQNFIRAKAVAQRNQFQQAVTFLENAIDLVENVPEYHVELGTILIRNPRRRDDAEEHLRRGIELDPTVAAGHIALADLMLKRDREDDARRVVAEGLKWVPANVELNQLAEQLSGGKKGRGLFGR